MPDYRDTPAPSLHPLCQKGAIFPFEFERPTVLAYFAPSTLVVVPTPLLKKTEEEFKDKLGRPESEDE